MQIFLCIMMADWITFLKISKEIYNKINLFSFPRNPLICCGMSREIISFRHEIRNLIQMLIIPHEDTFVSDI